MEAEQTINYQNIYIEKLDKDNEDNQRQLFRVRPKKLWAKINGVDLRLLDLSLGGLRVKAHKEAIIKEDNLFELSCGDGVHIKLLCHQVGFYHDEIRFRFDELSIAEVSNLAQTIARLYTQK